MKRSTVVLFSIILFLASAAGGFCLFQYQTEKMRVEPLSSPTPRAWDDGEAVTGQIRPGFVLPDLSGRLRNMDEWNGQVLVVNFWATWCPPCLKEIPEFVELQKKYAGGGLQFLGIALQKPEEVVDFARERGMNYPVLTGELEVIRLAESFGNTIGALPYTAVVDRTGRIHYVKAGPISGFKLEKIITPLL